MIGLDSNILLRAIANDDAEQSPIARRLLATLTATDPGLVNCIVLAELSWTLRVRYKRSRQEVIERIDTILKSSSYVVSDRDAVNRAVHRCRDSKLEFADALTGELNLLAGARTTLTFDEDASQTPAYELLS